MVLGVRSVSNPMPLNSYYYRNQRRNGLTKLSPLTLLREGTLLQSGVTGNWLDSFKILLTLWKGISLLWRKIVRNKHLIKWVLPVIYYEGNIAEKKKKHSDKNKKNVLLTHEIISEL